MEAEHASHYNHWYKADMPSGTGMKADSAGAWKGGVLRFDIQFKHPGKYALWVLGRKNPDDGKWSGDTKSAWTQEVWPDYKEWSHGGLKENIEMVANPALFTYAIPFFTHDGGGFKEFDSPDLSDEFYVRYAQFSSFNAIWLALRFDSKYNFCEIVCIDKKRDKSINTLIGQDDNNQFTGGRMLRKRVYGYFFFSD